MAAQPLTAPGFSIFGTSPSGLQIWIDDLFRGSSPLSLPLSAGKHSLRIVDPINRLSRSEQFTVRSGDTGRIDRIIVPPTGTLQLSSNPPGGSVSICAELGTTPFTNTLMVPGRYRIRIDPPDRRHSALLDSAVILPGELTVLDRKLPGRMVFNRRAGVRCLLGAATLAGTVAGCIMQDRLGSYAPGESDRQRRARTARTAAFAAAGASLIGLELLAFF